jgi:hypothetical protein
MVSVRRVRLGCIDAFLRFLIEEEVLRHEILSKRLTAQIGP